MGMPWPSWELRCSERGCPFPPAPNQQLCRHHLEMFTLDTSAIDDSQDDKFWGIEELRGIQKNFLDEGETTRNHLSIIGPLEAGISRWTAPQKRKDRNLFKVVWARNKRLKMRAAGLCIRCGRPSPRFHRCDDCRRKKLAEQNIRREERRRNGICPQCGRNPMSHGLVLCEFCHLRMLQRNRQKLKRMRERRKALGLCTQCSAPCSLGRRLCEKHIALSRSRYDSKRNSDNCKRRRLRLHSQGRCTTCGKKLRPTRAGKSECKKCYLRCLRPKRVSAAMSGGLEERKI